MQGVKGTRELAQRRELQPTGSPVERYYEQISRWLSGVFGVGEDRDVADKGRLGEHSLLVGVTIFW